MKATNNKTTTLTVITSSFNNTASKQYIAQIRRVAANEFDNILLNERHCETQSDLEYYLEHSDCKVLLIEPTDLKLNKNDQPRNAEGNQVCDAVIDMIENNLDPDMWTNPYSDRILIVGRGHVGREIHSRLIDLGYCVCLTGNKHDFHVDFLKQFRVMINCTKSTDVVELPFSGIVYDAAGNFKLTSTQEFVSGVKYNCTPFYSKVISCGAIGKTTTRFMLADVGKMR